MLRSGVLFRECPAVARGFGFTVLVNYLRNTGQMASLFQQIGMGGPKPAAGRATHPRAILYFSLPDWIIGLPVVVPLVACAGELPGLDTLCATAKDWLPSRMLRINAKSLMGTSFR
jgi:hypothetical protein